jgi:hypothetical protein
MHVCLMSITIDVGYLHNRQVYFCAVSGDSDTISIQVKQQAIDCVEKSNQRGKLLPTLKI